MKNLSLSKKLYVSVLFLSFLLFGIFQCLFGAEASVIKDFFNISSSKFGVIITLVSFGGLFISIFSAIFGENLDKMKMITLSLFLMLIGALGTIITSNFYVLLIFALLSGLAYTFLDVMNNAIIGDLFAENKKTLLPSLHMFFAVGATFGAFIAGFMVNDKKPQSYIRPFVLIAVCLIITLIFNIITTKKVINEPDYVKPIKTKQKSGEIFKYPAAWIILLAGIMHFSFQKGVQTWLPTYMMDNIGMSYENASITLTLFFLGAMFSRMLSPVLFNKFNIKRMTMLFMVISAISLALALICTNTVIAVILIFISGFFHGIFAAALVYIACDIFPNMPAGASSIVLISISLGGLTAPLWMGVLSDYNNIGLRIPMFIICIMMVFSSVFVHLAYKAANNMKK